MEQRINPQQLRFAKAYVKTGNGAESCRIAGYAHAGATSNAVRLLNLPHVSAAIARERKRIEEEEHGGESAWSDRLWLEARNNDSPASARIAALKLIGDYRGWLAKSRSYTGLRPIGSITFVLPPATQAPQLEPVDAEFTVEPPAELSQ